MGRTRNVVGTDAGGEPTGESAAVAVNEVTLVGRVSAAAEERELPSGDVLVSWRLIVDRPPQRRAAPAGGRAVVVDTVDCVAFTAAVRRTAHALAAGDVVRVEGALRRRFWRAGGGPSSRTEVEVAAVRRLVRAQASR